MNTLSSNSGAAILWRRTKMLSQAHPIVSVALVLAVGWSGYRLYTSVTSTADETRYITKTASKETIISSIAGTGQVSATTQLDIKPKASGEITGLPVTLGQHVGAGQAIAYLDSSTAQKSVRDAEANLESARIAMEKLTTPADDLSLTQSENALLRAQTSLQGAKDDLTKSYDDSFNAIANAFLDLPGVMTGIHDVLYTTNSSLGGTNVNNIDYYKYTAALYDDRGLQYGSDTDKSYQAALAAYNKNFEDYKALSRTSSHTEIESVLEETYATTLLMSDAVKNTNNLIQFFEDQMTQNNKKYSSTVDTQLTTLNGYTGKLTSHVSNLLNMSATLKSDKNTIAESERSVDEQTLSLQKLKAGATDLDIKSAQLTLTQRENALRDAKDTLADYVVRAPFAGVIAKISAKKGDSASSGTTIATLVTTQKYATISLNEVDVAKVKLGQKATITFDAIDGLSISGIVSSIDTIGTVSQGVVTYNVDIGFDTQDDRVKAGMSVSANIITDVHTDVVAVPSGAVKTDGEASYVEIFDPPLSGSDSSQGIPSTIAPTRKSVQIGSSSDTMTEILSGINAGDQVVVRTITAASTAATTNTTGSAGGGVRMRGFGL